MTNDISDHGYMDILQQAYAEILEYLQHVGDGLITEGIVDRVGPDGHLLYASIRPGRTMTWGILSGALKAIINYMGSAHSGAAAFAIFDGDTDEVATGGLSQCRTGGGSMM